MVIPYIHPIVVHFPIALLIVSVVFAIGWLASGAAWWRNTLLILTLIGAASSLVAVQSGEDVADAKAFQDGGWGELQELKNEHEELGEAALLGAFGTSVYFLAVFAFGVMKKREHDPIALRVIGLLACVACAVAVGLAGHKGGLLVWGEPPNATPASE